MQLAALNDATILIAQDRQQNFVTQVRFERMPVDIEIGRIPGARPVFEHIHPPLVERLGDSHMIRDEIEHLAHRVRMQFRNPRVVIFARADGRVELIVIGDVVAVQALRASLEIRRCISIARA